MFFASDNTAGAAPEIMAAIAAANAGHASSYGADDLTASVTKRVRDTFAAPDAAVYLVATGTAANALCIAISCPPWGAAYCHRKAHVETDECGAPEFFVGGGKLVLIDGEHGRMSPDALNQAINATPQGDVHCIQRGMLTVTNTTEAGTIYQPEDIRALTEIAKSAGLACHMDGSRLANAVVSAGCSPAEMTWKAGIDSLSLGGTKNGCLAVEAIVLFDPAKAWELELRRKRAGHLFSKHRFLAAQMDAYLENGLWLHLAQNANRTAARLASELTRVGGVTLDHPVEANIIFASMPRERHRRAMAKGAHYSLAGGASLEGPDDDPVSSRLVCSWSTTDADVERFVATIRGQD